MTQEAISKARNKKVVKSNDLIQKTKFDLTTQQQKVVLYLISQVNREDEDFKLYEFSINEFCEVCGIEKNNGGNIESIKEAIKEIADKSRWITLEDGKQTLFRWIETPSILPHKGTITLRLNPALKPFLLQQTGNFTQYDLIFVLNFKSKYAFRLYELIKSIHYDELYSYERIYTVDDLKALMGATGYYKTFSAFRERALEPAIAEINKFTDKIVSYETITQGKKVVKILLRVASKSSQEIVFVKTELEEILNAPNLPQLEDELKEKGWL